LWRIVPRSLWSRDIAGCWHSPDVVGYRLEAFQRKLARAVLGPERECLILLPRGNAKTTLTALVALHHLLSTEGAKVYFVAASVPQARIAFEAAADFPRRLGHDNVVFRHLELRWCEDPDEPTVFTPHMRVLGGEGPRLHGLSPTLMVLDELQAVTRTDILRCRTPGVRPRLERRPRFPHRPPTGPALLLWQG
jgi:phage terminase large subunit-like protein